MTGRDPSRKCVGGRWPLLGPAGVFLARVPHLDQAVTPRQGGKVGRAP